MDGSRFDELTRSLAGRRSRRKFLGLAGATAAVAAGLVTGKSAQAVTQGALPEGGCPDGLVRCFGSCVYGENLPDGCTVSAGKRESGDVCVNDHQCADGLICNALYGICAVCATGNSACRRDEDCCAGLYCDDFGTCLAP